MWDHRLGRTGNSATGTTSPQMVDYGCVTFDNSIHVEITSEAGIRYLFVLQTPDGGFDGFGSRSTGFQVSHGDTGGSGFEHISIMSPGDLEINLLAACFQVNLFIRNAMVPCARMDKDSRNRLRGTLPYPFDTSIKTLFMIVRPV